MKQDLIACALAGQVAGLISQIVDVDLILPLALQQLHGHDIWAEQVPEIWSWAAHLIYGFSLVLFVAIYDQLSHRTRETGYPTGT